MNERILTSGMNQKLDRQMIDIRGLEGKQRLAKGADMLADMLAVNQMFETYNRELRGLLGLRARPG